jgi:hypothetical protein
LIVGVTIPNFWAFETLSSNVDGWPLKLRALDPIGVVYNLLTKINPIAASFFLFFWLERVVVEM